MEPTEFHSALAIDVGEGAIRYVKNNESDFVKDKIAKVFFIKWC